MACSFLNLAGGSCGPDSKSKSKSPQVVSLTSCNKNISKHKKSLHFTGVDTEVELILARVNFFQTPSNLMEMTICPAHRESLGIGWRRSARLCIVPEKLSGHSDKSRMKHAERGCSLMQSKVIWETTGEFVQIGSAICTRCRKILQPGSSICDNSTSEPDIAEIAENLSALTLDEVGQEQAEGTKPAVGCVGKRRESVFFPSSDNSSDDSESGQENESTFDTSLEHLNEFLRLRSVSPVRHTLSVPWDTAHERTKQRYVKKAEQSARAVMEVIAPSDSEKLWVAIISKKTNFDLIEDENSSTKRSQKERELLEALSESYLNASHWSTRRQILSIVADKISFKELKEFIPQVTRYRYNIAKHHKLLHGRGRVLPSSDVGRMKVDQKQLDHFLSFITSPHIVQDMPFGEKMLKLSTGEVIKTPNVIRMLIPERITQQYFQFCAEMGFTPMSKRTQLRVLDVCSASVRTSLQGLDNFNAQGSKAFDDLYECVDKIAEQSKSQSWAKETKQTLRSSKQYLKSDYKVHIAKQSEVADHCQSFALSDPNESQLQEKCDHEHNEECFECLKLNEVMNEIETACEDLECEEVKEDTKSIFQQAKNNIKAWKAHQLRSVHQDQAKFDVLGTLDSKSVLLIMDWAMKYLPRKYRESQCDWFAKRGISWHITIVLTRPVKDGPLEKQTIVHIFQKCPQDSSAVEGILRDVLVTLKIERPELEIAYCKQDNAGCYHSGSTIVSGITCSKETGIKLERFDFSDPQGEKGEPDRQAATIKGHINIYLNEGHDVSNAYQMKEAIESNGGIPGVIVKCVAVPGSASDKTAPFKWEGISLLNNFKFEPDGIRVWRAYNIGQGKLMEWNSKILHCAKDESSIELEVLAPSAEGHASTFRNVKPRKTINLAKKSDGESRYLDMELKKNEERGKEEGELFTCSEESCVKTFQRFTALQAHLDCGKHKRALEKENLYDKAKRGYAAKITGERVQVPTVSSHTATASGTASSASIGWALKATKKKSKFSDKQKEYLNEQFLIGEERGKKSDPKEVSQDMRRARNECGARLFLGADVLTPEQISGYFSRLTAKRRKASLNQKDGDQSDEEEVAAATETWHAELNALVEGEVSLRHPIVSQSRNICKMVQMDKLSTLSIGVLRDVCGDLEIAVDDITQRRKKPFLTRIIDVVESCSCKGQIP